MERPSLFRRSRLVGRRLVGACPYGGGPAVRGVSRGSRVSEECRARRSRARAVLVRARKPQCQWRRPRRKRVSRPLANRWGGFGVVGAERPFASAEESLQIVPRANPREAKVNGRWR